MLPSSPVEYLPQNSASLPGNLLAYSFNRNWFQEFCGLSWVMDLNKYAQCQSDSRFCCSEPRLGREFNDSKNMNGRNLQSYRMQTIRILDIISLKLPNWAFWCREGILMSWSSYSGYQKDRTSEQRNFGTRQLLDINARSDLSYLNPMSTSSILLSKMSFLNEGLNNSLSSSSKMPKNVSSYIRIEKTKCPKARAVNINGDHKTGTMNAHI